MDDILEFEGPNRWLSNFWIERDGKSVEHRFQADKTTDPMEQSEILNASTPARAKRLGKRALHFRADWNEVRIDIMRRELERKFQDPELRAKLLATGNAHLSEGNYWHDNFWGICSCHSCFGKEGQNNLGKLLMELRSKLREEKTNAVDIRA